MREQFFKAVRQLEGGRPDETLATLEPLLARQPDNPDLLHLAGVATIESGAVEAGRKHLAKAASLAPDNPEIPYNHGSALLKVGLFEEALDELDRCLQLSPRYTGALQNRGAALKELGRAAEAEESYRRLMAIEPNHAGVMYNLGNLALEQGRYGDAESWYRRALGVRADHGAAWLGLGTASRLRGRAKEAVGALTHAVQLQPEDATTWSELGRAYSLAMDFEKAIEAHSRASQLDPGDADIWNDLGAAHTSIGELGPAEKAFQRALELAPDHEQALPNYAALLELANRPDEAMVLIRRGSSESPRMRLVEAKCAKRAGDLARAQALLEPLCDDADHGIAKDANFTLGQVLDKSGQAAEAFDRFAAGNRRSEQQWKMASDESDEFVPSLRQIHAIFADGAPWAERSASMDWPPPIFLFGFQRSGTTLLDTVLGTHERVHVMEELPVLNRVIRFMDRNFGPYPQELPKLTDDALAELRRCYLEEATAQSGYDPSGGQMLLDKSPLHTVHAGFIRMMFPESPMILALRHPMDVCLSCFMQDFTMTAFMTHYLTVKGVASVYARVMDLWLLYQQALAIPHHRFRYEALVEAPEEELRRAVEYCGLEWSDSLMGYREHARSRGLINTPSYEQVTQPIYRSASGRWQRYRKQLTAVEPILAPYVEAFGYSLDQVRPPLRPKGD